MDRSACFCAASLHITLLLQLQDLSALNRSLNRVIVVDTNKEAVKFHPENAIILDKWTGDIKDRTLWDLIKFLQSEIK